MCLRYIAGHPSWYALCDDLAWYFGRHQLSCRPGAHARTTVRGLPARPVLPDPLRVLRLQYLHPGPAGWRQPGPLAAGAAGGARTGGRQAGRTDGAYRVCGWRDAIAARGGAPGHVAGHGAGPLCAGARRRSQHRGQPRVDVAGVLRHDPRGRLHAGVARHAVGGPEGAGNLGCTRRAGRRPRPPRR